MISYNTIDKYRNGDRDEALISPRASNFGFSTISEIPKPTLGFSTGLIRSKSDSRFSKDNFVSFKHQANRILPGRLIHKYSNERKRAIQRSTSASMLEYRFGKQPSRMLPQPFGFDPSGNTNGRSALFLVPERSEKELTRFESASGGGLPTSFKTDEALQFFLNREPNCTILNLADLKFVDKSTICRLPGFCPKLRSLSLRGLTKSVDSAAFGACCQIKTLEEIDVSGCENITQRGLRNGFRCCRNIRSLRLDNCILDEKVNYPLLLHSLISNNEKLTELYMSNCSVYDLHFLNCYPKLKKLDKLMFEDFDYYLFQHTNEKKDNPDGNLFGDMMEANVLSSINSYDIEKGKTTETLQQTTVHMIPNISTRKNPLLSMLFSLKHLNVLDISYCKNLTDNGIKCISALCPNIQKLYLRCLDQSSVSDMAIHAITLGMKYINVLDIGGCTTLTSNAVEYIASGCNQCLEELVANGMNRQVDFININKLQKLRKIDVSNNFSVTPDKIDEVLQHCRFISEINVSYCKFVKQNYVLKTQVELARRKRNVNIIYYMSKQKNILKKESKAMLQARIKDLYFQCKEMDPTKKKKKKGIKKKKKKK